MMVQCGLFSIHLLSLISLVLSLRAHAIRPLLNSPTFVFQKRSPGSDKLSFPLRKALPCRNAPLMLLGNQSPPSGTHLHLGLFLPPLRPHPRLLVQFPRALAQAFLAALADSVVALLQRERASVDVAAWFVVRCLVAELEGLADFAGAAGIEACPVFAHEVEWCACLRVGPVWYLSTRLIRVVDW